MTRTPWMLLTLSLAGVFLAAGFLFQSRTPASTDHHIFVWGLFSTLCIMGTIATLFPHHCSPLTSLPEDLDPSRFTVIKGMRLVHGHHPKCERYKHHEFTLGGKTFCASCTGLFIGAIAALLITILYFVYNCRFPYVCGYVGLGCVILGLLYIPLLKTRIPLLRLTYNAFFVLGFSLVLVTVDGVGNLNFDLAVVGLCILWMFTRIQLSRWSYDTICGGCDEICEKKMI